jgi:hypothetical protein
MHAANALEHYIVTGQRRAYDAAQVQPPAPSPAKTDWAKEAERRERLASECHAQAIEANRQKWGPDQAIHHEINRLEPVVSAHERRRHPMHDEWWDRFCKMVGLTIVAGVLTYYVRIFLLWELALVGSYLIIRLTYDAEARRAKVTKEEIAELRQRLGCGTPNCARCA